MPACPDNLSACQKKKEKEKKKGKGKNKKKKKRKRRRREEKQLFIFYGSFLRHPIPPAKGPAVPFLKKYFDKVLHLILCFFPLSFLLFFRFQEASPRHEKTRPSGRAPSLQVVFCACLCCMWSIATGILVCQITASVMTGPRNARNALPSSSLSYAVLSGKSASAR